VFCSHCLVNVTFICSQLFQNHSEVFVFVILMTALSFLLFIVLPVFFLSVSIQCTVDMFMLCREFSVIHLTFNLLL
jgi:hypothetical protein